MVIYEEEIKELIIPSGLGNGGCDCDCSEAIADAYQEGFEAAIENLRDVVIRIRYIMSNGTVTYRNIQLANSLQLNGFDTRSTYEQNPDMERFYHNDFFTAYTPLYDIKDIKFKCRFYDGSGHIPSGDIMRVFIDDVERRVESFTAENTEEDKYDCELKLVEE